MTTPRRFGQPVTLADRVAAEQQTIAAGQATPCGFTCPCHGNITCIRAQHPNHGAHPTDDCPGDPCTKRPAPGQPDWHDDDRVPHAGYDPTGQLVQWCGPHQRDEHGELVTAEALAQQAAAARAEHTAAFLATLDLDIVGRELERRARAAQTRDGGRA